jgi:CrcB protein
MSQAGHATPAMVALLGTGFCGGFTTFSTFSFETLRLAEEGSLGVAVVNVLASVGVAMLAASGGWYVATMWWG